MKLSPRFDQHVLLLLFCSFLGQLYQEAHESTDEKARPCKSLARSPRRSSRQALYTQPKGLRGAARTRGTLTQSHRVLVVFQCRAGSCRAEHLTIGSAAAAENGEGRDQGR